MKSVICLLILIVTASFGLQAQRFGGNRPSVRWQQVNTAAARVIFPKGLDTAAVRVASIAERLSTVTLSTIGQQQQKINIVLQPYTIVSNGYVALGPFRSEFYITPSQNSFDLGSLRWQDMLAIHEYRHVQQYNNFDVGLSRAFRILFGQQGQELANSLSIPNWFWEGDAVFQETLVSRQGRGRLPFFFNDYRSLWLAHKDYSWMKLRNGSLRDFTPDHYRLGYMMVAYGREKYGDDFWRKVTQDAASFKGLFYPFQKAVKEYSGKRFNVFTKETLNYFKNQTDSQPPYAAPNQVAAKHFIADQEFPAYIDDETIVYVKSSYKQNPAFMVKRKGEERQVRVRDISLDNQFSYRNGKIVYASYRLDTRWSWNDYNELRVLDIVTGEQKTITRKTKYFSPDISEDGKTIVAVDVQPGAKTHLHVLDAETGAVIKELPNSENLFYTHPKFVNDKQVVATVRKLSGEMALALVDSRDGAVEYLTVPSFRVMGYPVVQHDTIYFTAAAKEYDKLFAITLADKKIFELSAPVNGIGAYEAAVAGNRISFTTFTAYGYRLQELDKNDIKWNETGTAVWNQPLTTFGIDLTKNSAAGLLDSVPSQQVLAKKYSKSFHLFNFHSLRPFVDDPNYTLSLAGENVLNTLQSELFFTYNKDEQYKQFGFNTTYGGLFPYLTAGTDYIVDRRSLYKGNHVYWNDWDVYGGLQLPLNLSRGKHYTNLTIGSNYTYNQRSFKGIYKDTFDNRSYSYLNNYIDFSNQSQQARQHIYPRFAQILSVNYKTAVTLYTANQLLANGSLYFPGFFLTHNIVINAAVAARDSLNQVRFSNGFPFSRGYTAENLYRMYKIGVNYHLPLAYPDWGVGNLVYFLRIRANAFYDFTRVQDFYANRSIFNADFRSTGLEIFFDTKWWNQLPVNFGFRYTHLLDPDLFGGRGPNWFEFVLPVNLLQR